MTERDKALSRCCKMLRMACDSRTPENEREAAISRAKTVAERWAFSEQEILMEQRRVAEYEEPGLARARRAKEEALRRARMQQARAGMEVGYNAEVIFTSEGGYLRFFS